MPKKIIIFYERNPNYSGENLMSEENVCECGHPLISHSVKSGICQLNACVSCEGYISKIEKEQDADIQG